MAKALTDRQAANAAKQLAYHRERIAQIEQRMAKNAAALGHYLQSNEQEAAMLPGGYVIARLQPSADDEGEIAVSVPQNADHGFTQLCLI